MFCKMFCKVLQDVLQGVLQGSAICSARCSARFCKMFCKGQSLSDAMLCAIAYALFFFKQNFACLIVLSRICSGTVECECLSRYTGIHEILFLGRTTPSRCHCLFLCSRSLSQSVVGLEQGETKATQPSLPEIALLTVVLCSWNHRNTFHHQKLTFGRLSVRDGKISTLNGFGVV
jgi:hypothetical protein